MDSLLCPSFSTYSSNNLNDVTERVIYENDHSYSQNDNDEFEFVAFQKTADEVFFDHGVFPVFNRDDEKRNSDAAEKLNPSPELMNRDGDRRNSSAMEIWIPLQKSTIGDEKQNIDPPMASSIKCKKSSLTGSSSHSSCSKRCKFLSLLHRSKGDGKELLNLVSPVENSKVKSDGKGSTEENIAKAAEKKIPVTERKFPAPVTAMGAFNLRKKEIKRKSYLPYKLELIGFPIHV